MRRTSQSNSNDQSREIGSEPDFPTLCSGEPWNITLVLKRIGSDLLCRIHGGAQHAGAIAVGRWEDGRSQVETITVGQHKEGPLATRVADQLCSANRTVVVCIAGIHYDGIGNEQIASIIDDVHALSNDAARILLEKNQSSC